jgi:IS5 family transposase
MDARWVVKNSERQYGYKDHINMDKKSKIITKYMAADAAVHDSQQVKKDKIIYEDRAYTGKELQTGMAGADIQIGLMNLAYNLYRYAYINDTS